MEATKVLQPADRMTTAQCVIECSGYLRTIANQEFEGEDWQTAPKYRRRNLLTDFLCNLELSGEEFAELCGLIGFQLSKTTTAKLAKFTVIAYDWQSEANGEVTADILAALDKCEGVTLIEERGYHPQARTYDTLRFHIAAFWRCLVNELRSICLGVGLVIEPKEIAAQAAEAPRISTEAAETANVSAEGENAKNEPIKHISEVLKEAEQNYQCVKSETLHTVRETDGKWHTYFMGDEIGIDLAYDQINHIPASRTAQAAEEVAEIRRYMNRLNGILLADADYYLAEMREGIKQAEAARRKKNADTESEDAAEPRKTTLSSREQVLSYLDKLHGMEYDAGEVVYFKDGCTAEEHEDGAVWHVYPDTESDEAIQTLRIAPQMPETPQTIECTADTPKPRETARKRPNRAIGCAQRSRHSGLGAGGYSMLNNASATLAAMSVPRECYTADYR